MDVTSKVALAVAESHAGTADALMEPFLRDEYDMKALEGALTSGRVSPNHREKPEAPPFLSLLAYGGHARRLWKLLLHRANPDLTDVLGVTAVMAAIYGRRVARRARRNLTKLDPRDHFREVLFALVHAGANLNLRDVSGHTALDLAVTFQMQDAVRFLTRSAIVRLSGVSQSEGDAGTDIGLQIAQGLRERVLPASLLVALLRNIISARVAGLVHEYLHVLPYWDQPGDHCLCDLCMENPMEPETPLVVYLADHSSVAGLCGGAAPTFRATGAREHERSVHGLYRRVQSLVGQTPFSVQRHNLLVVWSGGWDDRRRLAALIFDGLHCRWLATVHPYLMSLYSTGRKTGVVVQVGEIMITVACICYGFLATEEHLDSADCSLRLLARHVVASVHRAGPDTWRELWQHVLLAGTGPLLDEAVGAERTCCFFKQLLEEERPKTLLPLPLDVVAASEHSVWVGASIVGTSVLACGMWRSPSFFR